MPPLSERLESLRAEMLAGRAEPPANLHGAIESAAASRCISWLQRELAPYDAEMARLREENLSMAARQDDLRELYEDARKRLVEAEAERDRLRAQSDNLAAELAAMASSAISLREQLREAHRS